MHPISGSANSTFPSMNLCCFHAWPDKMFEWGSNRTQPKKKACHDIEITLVPTWFVVEKVGVDVNWMGWRWPFFVADQVGFGSDVSRVVWINMIPSAEAWNWTKWCNLELNAPFPRPSTILHNKFLPPFYSKGLKLQGVQIDLGPNGWTLPFKFWKNQCSSIVMEI